MLAYFRNCDPVQNGDIEKYDAMMPYFTTQLFKNSPGMVGLFISAAYSEWCFKKLDCCNFIFNES